MCEYGFVVDGDTLPPSLGFLKPLQFQRHHFIKRAGILPDFYRPYTRGLFQMSDAEKPAAKLRTVTEPGARCNVFRPQVL